MKRLDKLWIGVAAAVMLTGCATTKVNLYDYKDVSSVNIVDENKAGYRVVLPRLDPDIRVETNGWDEFGRTMSDYFLAYNDRSKVFVLDPHGEYRLTLSLHNIGSSQRFTPSRYVEVKRKIKTDKGVVIRDESYYTRPYWTYTVETSIVAEMTSAEGSKTFYDASDASSFSVEGQYPSPIPRARYVESLQQSLSELMRRIGNDVAAEGLVVSKKVALDDDEDCIFMVNMGKEEGLHEGQSLNLFKEVVFKDEIDAKTITNKVRIGTAKVSDQIMPHYAWIILDDDDQNGLVEVGDIIRPSF